MGQRVRSDLSALLVVIVAVCTFCHITINLRAHCSVIAMQFQTACTHTDDVACCAACHILLRVLGSEIDSRPASRIVCINFQLKGHQLILIGAAGKGHKSIQGSNNLLVIRQRPGTAPIDPGFLIFFRINLPDIIFHKLCLFRDDHSKICTSLLTLSRRCDRQYSFSQRPRDKGTALIYRGNLCILEGVGYVRKLHFTSHCCHTIRFQLLTCVGKGKYNAAFYTLELNLCEHVSYIELFFNDIQHIIGYHIYAKCGLACCKSCYQSISGNTCNGRVCHIISKDCILQGNRPVLTVCGGHSNLKVPTDCQ